MRGHDRVTRRAAQPVCDTGVAIEIKRTAKRHLKRIVLWALIDAKLDNKTD